MRALFYDEYGPPEVLRIEEMDRPEPGSGEVCIEVCAAGVNSWDWDNLVGSSLARPIWGWFKPGRQVLGCDVAGRVDAVGPGVTRLKVGDAVFGDISGHDWGGFADFVCAPEAVLAKKPDTLSWEAAASLPQAGVLALQSLDKRPPGPGDRVLLVGAGGGVGTLALQMCKNAGAHVTCVDSGPKLHGLTELGADEVIDYQRTDFTELGQTWDLIVDVVGKHSLGRVQRAIAPGGAYAMVGGSWRHIFQVALGGPFYRLADKRIGLVVHEPKVADLQRIADEVTSGRVHTVIDRVCPLEEAPAALGALGAGEVFGKVVVRP